MSNITNRGNRLIESNRSMSVRYKNIVGLLSQNCLYSSYVSDECRTTITRWRLSNYRLAIETGRYNRPKTDRENRVCKLCLKVEDEEHVIYHCPLYKDIRSKYKTFIDNKCTVKSILNPENLAEIYITAKLLQEIESLHKK